MTTPSADWLARIADQPKVAFGGDPPGMAVERLRGTLIADVEAVASRDD